MTDQLAGGQESPPSRPEPAPAAPPRRARVTPPLALAGVALVSAVAGVLLVPVTMGLGWDEVVYVSQFSPHAPAAFFSAPRSWGVPLLSAPVVLLTGSVPALRLYLAAVSAAGLVAAFWPWLRVAPRPGAVPLAAGLYAGLWVSLFYASEAMPNHFTALGGVAAVGWYLVAVSGPPAGRTGRGALVGVAAGLAVAALMRPSDGFWLGVPLVVATVVVAGWRRLSLLVAVTAGLAAGALPWVVEAFVRHGGVVERIRRAGEIQGGTGLTNSLPELFGTLDGPLLCRPCTDPRVEWPAVLWWLAVPPLAAVGVVAARRAGRLAVAALPVGVAAGAAATYLVLIDYAAPRFLMPAYALLAVPVAVGAVALVARVPAPGRRPALLAAGLGLAGHLAIQAGIAAHWADSHQAARRDYERIRATLAQLGVRPPCLLTGEDAIPVAYYAGCGSTAVSGNNRDTTGAELLRRSAQVPTALLLAQEPVPPYAREWPSHPVVGLEQRRDWRVLVPPERAPAGLRVPAPPP